MNSSRRQKQGEEAKDAWSAWRSHQAQGVTLLVAQTRVTRKPWRLRRRLQVQARGCAESDFRGGDMGGGGGFVSWDGETCIANTGLVDRNSGRRLTTQRQKGEERQV